MVPPPAGLISGGSPGSADTGPVTGHCLTAPPAPSPQAARPTRLFSGILASVKQILDREARAVRQLRGRRAEVAACPVELEEAPSRPAAPPVCGESLRSQRSSARAACLSKRRSVRRARGVRPEALRGRDRPPWCPRTRPRRRLNPLRTAAEESERWVRFRNRPAMSLSTFVSRVRTVPGPGEREPRGDRRTSRSR